MKSRLIRAGLATEQSITGCSEEEVVAVERAFGSTLPQAYRAFLLSMGKGAGDFWSGTNFLFPKLLERRSTADCTLRESNADWQLGPRDFVFAMHQGYELLYFEVDGNDDPRVSHYLEGDSTPRRVAASFSVWLDQCVADEVAAAKACRPPG